MRPLTKLGARISNQIGRAIADYRLIEDGDRIVVAVSGGKDSLSLLKLLNVRRKWAPVNYELLAVHIETDYRCRGCVHKDTLKKFFEENHVNHHFEKISILNKKKRSVSCFWCSWNRRKTLFLLADKFGYNKVALGHHKDDIVETLLLNVFFNGEFSTMNPRQDMFGGKLAIIRPLCYVEEESLKRFAKESNFPRQMCQCPNSYISKRKAIKDFIKLIEKDSPYVKTNIFKSITRVKQDYINLKPETKPEGDVSLLRNVL